MARIRSGLLPALGAALFLLLLLAGVVQYRWIDRVSEADRRQRQDYLETTLRTFDGDFKDTILNLLPSFRASPMTPPGTVLATHLSRLTSQWRAASNRPGLLKSVGLGTEERGRAVFKRLPIG